MGPAGLDTNLVAGFLAGPWSCPTTMDLPSDHGALLDPGL